MLNIQSHQDLGDLVNFFKSLLFPRLPTGRPSNTYGIEGLLFDLFKSEMEERVMCMSWHKDKNNQEIQTYLELERNIETTFYPEMKTRFV